ncbi:MAG: type II toxin-antitoxin system prevent-host-death family antitoxin [Actinomycetota bacterium]|nr:type II toxin-antitoxin system prevent-host-death family antitoxin [Actinomycetota bacterium]
MKTIPQRELRNNSSAVLRAAEKGEIFAITVDGRPVATLGPYRKRQWVPSSSVEELLRSPTDESLLDDLRAFDVGGLEDPWERQ